MDYSFLQHYWCFLVSLLGALLVFLLFVQGANSMVRSLGYNEEGRRLIINSTGRKWEFTFTTLVTFGGAFFASFPLFYSTSFGGAYWLWMIILFTFVVQAVSYEFQNKLGNFLGAKTFQMCLVVNGLLGPLLLGGAVATFFEGSNFIVMKDNLIVSQLFLPLGEATGGASLARDGGRGGVACDLHLGQRLSRLGCLVESVGVDIRIGSHVPGTCLGHPIHYQ